MPKQTCFMSERNMASRRDSHILYVWTCTVSRKVFWLFTFYPGQFIVIWQFSLQIREHCTCSLIIVVLPLLRTHTHTHPFNGPVSGTTRVTRYQTGKTNLDFTEARHSEWQWNQLGHMQVCTSLQTDNHANTPPLAIITYKLCKYQ